MRLVVNNTPEKWNWSPPSFEKEDAEAPVFNLVKLGRRERAEIRDRTVELLLSGEAGNQTARVCTQQVNLALVCASIVGWYNVFDGNGKQIAFVNKLPQIESVLDSLGDSDFDAFVQEVTDGMTVVEEAKKIEAETEELKP